MQKAAIREYQCPGCSYGCDPETCTEYQLCEDGEGFQCAKHYPSTIMYPGGKICLGLPTGFNHINEAPGQSHYPYYIRIHTKLPTWNKLNLPVWAMEKDGALFVRTYSPRVGREHVDVILGGKFAEIPTELHPIDVTEFVGEMD